MAFETGNKLGNGRPKGSKGAQVKAKVLQKWGKVFSDLGEEELKKLCQENFVEFMRIGYTLMPKDDPPKEPGNQDSNGFVHGITKDTQRKIREEIYGIRSKDTASSGN